MNFKRMNVLLIMLALVVLVGLGSVSAASDDGADIISDSITDDMLLDDGVTDDTDPSDPADPTEPGESTDPVETEKINTTVESANVTAQDNETASISVAVKDNESQEISVNESVLSVYEGDKSINFTYNGTINLVDKLDLGNHTLIIAYLGNETYAASNTTITLSIYGNETLNAPDTVIVDNEGNVVIPITVTNGVNETEVTQENITITLTKDGANSTITDVVDSKINLELGNEFTNAVLTVVYIPNNYTKTIAIKKGSNLTADDTISFNITDQFIIPVNITDSSSANLTVSKSDLVVSEGNKTLNFTYANSNITITSDLAAGVHNITIFYKGNDTYGNATKDVIVNVYKNMTIEAPSSIDVNTTKNATISINVTNGIDYLNLTDGNVSFADGVGLVNFTDGNLTITVTYLNESNETVVANISNLNVTDGVITFTLDNNNFTSGNVTLSFNETYNATVTLNNIINVIITPINTTGHYQSGNLTFKVTDADGETDLTNKTVNAGFYVKVGSISFGLSSSLVIDENGIARFNLNTEKFSTLSYFISTSYVPVGDYEFTISGQGQLKGENKTNATVEKTDVIISADQFTRDYGTTDKFKITVTSKETGELMKDVLLSLYMPQTAAQNYTFRTNENGTCEITVSGLVGGTYDVALSTNDNNTNNASKNTTIVINKIKVKINTSSKTMYYNSGSTAKITITNSKTGKAVAGVYVFVRLYTSSTKYNDYLFMTNNKGVVEFSAPLNVGKHKMIVTTADTRYDGGSVTKTITVKSAPAKITAAKKTAYYKQGKYFVIKVTNTKNKKPIYNAKLNIRVFVSSKKYYNFNGRTGANGQIKLSMDFKPGTYKVVVIDKDSNMVAKQITSKMVIKKAPAKFKASKVTAKKKANKYFKVKVINKKTKKIIAGVKVKVKVYTGKKSKTYTIKTNSKGIAKLSTKSLKVGKHKVVITSGNKYVKASKKTSSIKITK